MPKNEGPEDKEKKEVELKPTSLFGNFNSSAPNTGGLFGNSAPTGCLFGNNTSAPLGGSLFGNTNGTTLFGVKPTSTLFGDKPTGSLFTNTSSLFGN